jgi:CheY-like chemotaxis protein
MNTRTPIEILLVEDSPTDILMAREAFRETQVANNLRVVDNGEDAMRYLTRQAPYEDVPRADLVLLDLNLPRKSGREVLAEVKSNDALKHIPVVVLSTSRACKDIEQAYHLHANCYMSKPLDFMEFRNALRTMEDFWLCVAALPQNKD